MSKQKIQNLGDLSDFLQSLKVSQLEHPPTILPLNHEAREIVEAEITEEPFLVHNVTGECGYPSELKRQLGKDFDLRNYTVEDPIGTVIFYAK